MTDILRFQLPERIQRRTRGIALQMKYDDYMTRLKETTGISYARFIESLIQAHMDSTANPFRHDGDSSQAV